MKISYCRVTFDDGSTADLELKEAQILFDAMKTYAASGKECVLECKQAVGEYTFFFISKVQDVFISTPATRARYTELNTKLAAEKELNEGPSWL